MIALAFAFVAAAFSRSSFSRRFSLALSSSTGITHSTMILGITGIKRCIPSSSVTQLDELGIFYIGYAGEATETPPEKWVELEQWKV
jgi:hypothetical protein